MRRVFALVAALGLMSAASASPVPAPLAPAWSVVVMAQQPDLPDEIDIDINGGSDEGYWASPTWIAIGVIGIVLLVVIVAMISRGGGTTVIKE